MNSISRDLDKVEIPIKHGEMAENPALKRVAFSPGELAKLFGKSQNWGYRQIYSGKVKAITEYGRILIPAAEVEAILERAGIYDGLKPISTKAKANIQVAVPRFQNAWQTYLASRKNQPLRRERHQRWRLPSRWLLH